PGSAGTRRRACQRWPERRPTCGTTRRSTPLAAEDRSQYAAQHLPAELRADRARRALAHGFENALRLPAAARPGLAEEDVGHRVRALLRLGRLRLRAAFQLFISGLAVDRGVVFARDR